MIALATGVLAIVALFIYINRPGPCDGIFEQTAPKLDLTLAGLKLNGGMVIGRDKIQDLSDGAQKVGEACKACCINLQSGKITAAQYQDCMNATQSYETHVIQVASSVDLANSARQKGQVQLVSDNTQQAMQAASAATGDVQKLAGFAPQSNSPTVADNSSSPNLNAPPKSVVITKIDGTSMWVYEDGFGFNGYSDGLPLESGQSIDYPKVKAIEILGADSAKYKLRITIVGGETVEGIEDGHYGQNAGGKNDLGAVDIPLAQVKRVDFRR